MPSRFKFILRSTLPSAFFLTIFLAVFLLVSPTALAEEKILNYEVTATVNKDASMSVRERITINVEHNKIKRGIFRHVPVVYPTTWGTTHVTGFTLGDVLLDGRTVPCKRERANDSVLLMIGDPNRIVSRGEHTYEINFTLTGHIRFLENSDAIYYNVTGNEWDFSIENASFTIVLPPGAEGRIQAKNAYTGKLDDEGTDFTTDGQTTFRTTRKLRRGEGLTVAFDWEKGFIDRPDASGSESNPSLPINRLTGETDDVDPSRQTTGQESGQASGQTSGQSPDYTEKQSVAPESHSIFSSYYWYHIIFWLRMLIVPLACLICFYILWRKYGVDPLQPPVVPLFHPPAGMTPGYAAFLKRNLASSNTFSGDLMKLATDGYIRFQNAENGSFTLTRTEKERTPGFAPLLSPILDKAFKSGNPINSSEKAGKDALGDAYEEHVKDYSRLKRLLGTYNFGRSLIGIVICAALVWLVLPLTVTGSIGFGAVRYFWLYLIDEQLAALAMASTFTMMISMAIIKNMVADKKTIAGSILVAVILLFMTGICAKVTWDLSPPIAVSLILSVLIVSFFTVVLMPKKSETGLVDRAKALGLEMYISIAEEKRLAVINAPEDSVDVYESLLPYAIAFGLADAWEERFSSVLEKANYKPTWQDGGIRTRSFYAAALGASMVGREVANARAAARAAAAKSKGSSWSGRSGSRGGRSGGGSGGGGGGGW